MQKLMLLVVSFAAALLAVSVVQCASGSPGIGVEFYDWTVKPSWAPKGTTVTAEVTVKNTGDETGWIYVVFEYEGGLGCTTSTKAIPPGEIRDFACMWTVDTKPPHDYWVYAYDYDTGNMLGVGTYSERGVGGTWLPVDKFGLLAPYIGLASTMIVAAVTAAFYVRRRKKEQ